MLHSFYQTTASIIQKLVQNKFYIHYKLQHQRIFMRYKICNCNRHFRFLARISLIQKGISGSYTQITSTFFIRWYLTGSQTKRIRNSHLDYQSNDHFLSVIIFLFQDFQKFLHDLLFS